MMAVETTGVGVTKVVVMTMVTVDKSVVGNIKDDDNNGRHAEERAGVTKTMTATIDRRTTTASSGFILRHSAHLKL